ncbi:MAG TPA: type II toxin-antitoxin system VapC family toxin [Thermoanaerobaculia bacterium]|nr:type II toxin-antitoxin system VapC family toxin [Thermoanaerobaculia bacterium]
MDGVGGTPRSDLDCRGAESARSGTPLIDVVVDASVAFKWLVPDAAEDDVPEAKALLVEHLEGRAKIVVPPLLYYEVGNILLFGRSRPPVERALDVFAGLYSIALEVSPLSLGSAEITLRLAALRGISFYDATYVALAEMLDCPLITADRRLADRTRAMGRVRLLGKQ